MICPMMSTADSGEWFCEREKCAWYTGEQCVVLAIAKTKERHGMGN